MKRLTRKGLNSVLFIVLFIAGCAGTTVSSVETPTYLPIPCDGDGPYTHGVALVDVFPSVIKGADGKVYVAMTPEDYEKLAANMAALKRALEQKNSVIRFYKDCIENHNRLAKEQRGQEVHRSMSQALHPE